MEHIPVEAPPAPQKTEADYRAALQSVVGRLEGSFKKREGQRKKLEERWIQDIQQYYGDYDPKMKSELEAQDKSTIFINETMPKTDALVARLYDMLFPTDDRNWGIGPTPDPTLAPEAEEMLDNVQKKAQEANAALKAGDPARTDAIIQEVNAQAESVDQKQAEQRAAEKAADAMQTEIDDQLKECGYAAETREGLEDMGICGAMVMEGPVANDRIRQVWQSRPVIDEVTGEQKRDASGAPLVEDVLKTGEDQRPAARRVDFWGFFPQPGALKPEDSEDFYVRRLNNERQLRALARQPGFDKSAVAELIAEGPKEGGMPWYLAELRKIEECDYDTSENRFAVIEYRGPLKREDMKDVCECLKLRALDAGDEKAALKFEKMAKAGDDADPLLEINVVVWFCQGRLLKFGIHHLDRGDCIYSVVPLAREKGSMWGRGVPALMRDPQSGLNGAVRMMMDNGGLSAAPMIFINEKYVEPEDGNWDVYPKKIWRIKPETPANVKLFDQVTIDSNQSNYAGIAEIMGGYIDSMSGQPKIAQGEQPTGITKTLGGMSMLMNSANILIRRIVRNFDDRLTTPMIRRFYDWNMQFNPKREIKGDMEIEARGSSVLLVKELQSQNIMAFALNFAGHPIFGRFVEELDTFKEVARANMIPVGKVVKSDQKIKDEEAERAANPPPDPEAIKHKNALEIEDARHAHRMQELALEQDNEMMKLASAQNTKLEDIRAWLTDRREERDAKARIFSAEVAVESRNAGGKGSGGYVSAPPAAAAQPKQPQAAQ